MHIHFVVNAFLDWAPVPEDVKPTQADKDAKRVKELSPGKWSMRVTVPGRHTVDPTLEPHHHDQTMHEAQITDRLVVLAMCGKGLKTRAQIAVELIGYQAVEHVEPHHVDRIDLHDDGPNEAMCLAKIESFGDRISPDLAERILAAYTATGDDPKDPSGVLALLNATYGAPRKHAHPAKPGKEKP